MEAWEESLEEQLKSLEIRVFGGDNTNATGYSKCVDRVAYFNNRLNSAITGRDKITNMLKKLDNIEKYLDPEYVDCLTLPDDAKLQLITAQEKIITDTVARLEEIEKLKPVLNSEHIKNTPNLSNELLRLSEIEIKQQEEVNSLCSEVEPLVASYNSIIQTLTKQFIQWDDLTTKLEMKSQMAKTKN
uniref:Dynactin subunit 3 n=1 Tax=Strigamia maritima TaxID=126957 RepID=T1JJY4_STRMM